MGCGCGAPCGKFILFCYANMTWTMLFGSVRLNMSKSTYYELSIIGEKSLGTNYTSNPNSSTTTYEV